MTTSGGKFHYLVIYNAKIKFDMSFVFVIFQFPYKPPWFYV